ncbi:MAG: hypothetical protein NTW10_03305 [Bacteroidetes bacterium]|nr:hypothetical protein [Bacteroidota bacterium]
MKSFLHFFVILYLFYSRIKEGVEFEDPSLASLSNKITDKDNDMNMIKKTILPVILATAWISLSEFVRNEFLVKSFWTDHYKALGLTFPSAPINGALWGVWSLFFAVAIFILAKKFTLIQTTFLSWFVGFVLMWVVIGNLAVLPYGLLVYAIPLSILESFIAAWIIKYFQGK